MKRLLILLILAGAATLSLSSCIEDSHENHMVDDQLSIIYDEVVTEVSLYGGSHTVSILKSGKGKTAATARIGSSSDALHTYMESEENDGRVFSEIPSSNYSFSRSSVEFEAEDVRQTLTVDWDPRTLGTLVDGDGYVIPVSILDGSIDISRERRNLLLLNLLKSTVGFASTGSSLLAKETPEENGEVQVKIKLDQGPRLCGTHGAPVHV